MEPLPVFIASMKLRGEHAKPPDGYTIEKVNVTSAQRKSSQDRITFAPMNGIPYEDPHEGKFKMGFEAYWQSLKKIEGLDHFSRKVFWKTIPKPRRSDPKRTIMKHGRVVGKRPVLYALHKRFPYRQLGYVESRKEILVPDYYNLIKETPRFLALKRMVQTGGSDATMPRPSCCAVVVYCFGGPKTADGGVTCERVTVEMLKERINDASKSFGPGYVLAAGLMGILPEQYCA